MDIWCPPHPLRISPSALGCDKILINLIFKHVLYSPNTRAHFRWGLGSKYWGTNLDWFEANWTFELDLALNPSLHLGSSNHDFSFWGLNQLIFLSNSLQCRFSFNLPLFGLGPSFKGHGSSYLWLSSNRIALFHWTLDLAPLSKVMAANAIFLGVLQFLHPKTKVWGLHCIALP